MLFSGNADREKTQKPVIKQAEYDDDKAEDEYCYSADDL